MRTLVRATLAAVCVLFFIAASSGSLASGSRRRTPVPQPPHRTVPGSTITFTATAYCQHGKTQSGVGTRSGIAAADPEQLPVGSVVRIETVSSRYSGIYTVLDTGSKVLGRKVDLFMRDCTEAQRFGKQPARITVLRKGWSPKASAPAHTVVAAGVGGD